MKAMIFAAGLGTRLKPLTDSLPKALVQINGKPLLEWLLIKMAHEGIRDVVVNVHHFAGQVKDFLNAQPVPGLNIFISDETDFLLDTGGGLKRAASLLSGTEPVLIHNTDILSSISFSALEQAFTTMQADAMLLVKDRSTSRKLEFSSDGKLTGWINESIGESIAADASFGTGHRMAYSGIAVVGAGFPASLPMDGAFGLIPACLQLTATKRIIEYTSEYDWLDVGKSEAIEPAGRMIEKYYTPLL